MFCQGFFFFKTYSEHLLVSLMSEASYVVHLCKKKRKKKGLGEENLLNLK